MASNTITLEDYIKETKEAGIRARQIVFLLSLASILSFMAYWNSRSNAWSQSRLEFIESALECYQTYSKNCDNELIQKYIKEHGKIHLDNRNDIFRQLNRESYLVRVPILGIAFDINDLGVFSGFTFTFLLLLFWFSLEREEENLHMVFEMAVKEGKLLETYNYLSMSQVLTLPQREYTATGEMWKYVPKLIYLTPFIVYVIIFINDFQTIGLGFRINEKATVTALLLTVLLLSVITILSFLCLHRSFRVDKLWKSKSEKIKLDNVEPKQVN